MNKKLINLIWTIRTGILIMLILYSIKLIGYGISDLEQMALYTYIVVRFGITALELSGMLKTI